MDLAVWCKWPIRLGRVVFMMNLPAMDVGEGITQGNYYSRIEFEYMLFSPPLHAPLRMSNISPMIKTIDTHTHIFYVINSVLSVHVCLQYFINV